jgi:hypothetical protein
MSNNEERFALVRRKNEQPVLWIGARISPGNIDLIRHEQNQVSARCQSSFGCIDSAKQTSSVVRIKFGMFLLPNSHHPI